MSHRPEDRARQNIDRMLQDAGWVVQDRSHFNLSAGRGVAIRELSVKTGAADYALFVVILVHQKALRLLIEAGQIRTLVLSLPQSMCSSGCLPDTYNQFARSTRRK